VDCPKCGMSQDDGREECASCGIIFDRWQRAQDEAELRRRAAESVPLEIEEEGLRVSKWIIAIVLAFIFIFGTIWTVRRREARAKVDLAAIGKAHINKLNNDGLKMRQRLQDEAQRAQQMRYDQEQATPVQGNTRIAAPRQFSLKEEDVMSALFPCSDFLESRSILLPKEYNSDDRDTVFETYPELFNAQRSRLLFTTTEGSMVRHSVGVTGGIMILERDDHFEVLLGAKRVQAVKEMTGDADRVHATFTWSYDQRVAAEVLLGIREEKGEAQFLRQNGVWRMTHATISDGKVSRPVCGNR
jgi:hypothetical protein